jgi:hypothetical protein
MRQARPLAIFLTSALLAAAGADVSAQTVPERECSPADIELALAGDYAGPPCRFTQMPEGASPSSVVRTEQSRPEALLGGPVPPSAPERRARPDTPDLQPAPEQHAGARISRSRPGALLGAPVSHRPAAAPRPAPARHAEVRTVPPRSAARMDAFVSAPPPREPRYRPPATEPQPIHVRHGEVRASRSRPVELPGSPVSASVSPDFHHRRAYPDPLPAPVRHVEAESERTVVLDETFFASGLTGGVERPYRPLHVYRGVILIAADGEMRTGFPGWHRRVGTARVMDRLPAQPPRAYPYD